jgi:hypothetical protein
MKRPAHLIAPSSLPAFSRSMVTLVTMQRFPGLREFVV